MMLGERGARYHSKESWKTFFPFDNRVKTLDSDFRRENVIDSDIGLNATEKRHFWVGRLLMRTLGLGMSVKNTLYYVHQVYEEY